MRSPTLTINVFFGVFSFLLFAENNGLVESSASFDPTVVCLTNDPTICVGEREFQTPSSTVDPDCDDDNCTTTYVGGWSWNYRFVQDLSEGTSTTALSSQEREEYFTGLAVVVEMEDDFTCSVIVGEEECDSCTACDSDSTPSEEHRFSADCTNVQNGRNVVDCELAEPIFYPLKMFVLDLDASTVDLSSDSTPTPAPATSDATDTDTEGTTSEEGDEGAAQSTSSDSPSGGNQTQSPDTQAVEDNSSAMSRNFSCGIVLRIGVILVSTWMVS